MSKNKKYTIKEFWKSLYYELNDCDGDFDGYLHIVSTIDGSEVKINLKEIININKYCTQCKDYMGNHDCDNCAYCGTDN